MERLVEAIQRAELKKVRVSVLTDVCRIEGDVHLPPESARFSDGWEAIVADGRTFVPMTNATVTALDGTVSTTAFLQATKSQIRAVVPVETGPSEDADDPDR